MDRKEQIKDQLMNLSLKVHMHYPKTKINKKTDIYLVNSFGKTKSFYSIIKNVFLGGSLINHGGQNPLEATRYGCNIMHGPSVENFNEIFQFLKKRKNGQVLPAQKLIILLELCFFVEDIPDLKYSSNFQQFS